MPPLTKNNALDDKKTTNSYVIWQHKYDNDIIHFIPTHNSSITISIRCLLRCFSCVQLDHQLLFARSFSVCFCLFNVSLIFFVSTHNLWP